ncbi:MAG TPA: methyltransferase [Polyangiales bacterium]|nr:methyltransferase [Polyangiales bacterium]
MPHEESIGGTPAEQLAKWITGKWISHSIHAAARLSIADLLADGDKSLTELAEATNTHAPSLYRLLRALASIGIFRESSPRHFASTPVGDLMRSEAMRAACLLAHSSWHDRAWAELFYSLKTGSSAFEHVYGDKLFNWLNQHPEENELFSQAMTAGKLHHDAAIMSHYDFSGVRRVVDVGGGHGSLVISLLRRHAHLSAIIGDVAQVAAGAREQVRLAELQARCEVVTCDFFSSVPAGGDLYMLSHVLHDWDDDTCIQILSNCRAAMHPQASLLVIESIVAPGDQADRVKWLDLEMLVLTPGGRERTAEEYARLLRCAGLRLNRTIRTHGRRDIIEATLENHDAAR